MKITIDKKYSHLEAQMRNIPMRIMNDDCDIVYRGRNIVARMDIGGRPYMVKQYKRVNVIQQVAYTFFYKTKAERAFLFAQEFERRRGYDILPLLPIYAGVPMRGGEETLRSFERILGRRS